MKHGLRMTDGNSKVVMNELFENTIKTVKVVVALIVAAVLVYRGNTYLDPRGPGMLVPAMCIVLAMLVIGTTVAMTFKSQPAETSFETA